MDHQDAALDRRTLLRGAAGTTAAAIGGVAATGSAAAQTQEIVVGPSDDTTSFAPDSVSIAPGTEVSFVWESGGHNVVVDSQPDGAGWEGQPASETFDTGYTYSHTFETEGTYEYYCDPHLAQNMEGSIEVTQNPGGGGGGNAGPPEVSDAAMGLTTGLIGALGAVFALAFYFMKYGGTDEE